MRHPLTIALTACLALAACDSVEQAIDCIDDDRPQFSSLQLPEAVLNETYNATITARISNEPNDDDFTYTFMLDGALPPGISYRVDGRSVVFEGAATETGTWLPTLNVRVSDGGGTFADGGDADTLCRTTRTETYTLLVVEA